MNIIQQAVREVRSFHSWGSLFARETWEILKIGYLVRLGNSDIENKFKD